ncbi:DoxX family protein [Myxosarcina sp. GI1]|uniref:DoxX family protein n=1 Tax=Myxosarcina sp. GI1 TaxID=1541065 RepID=UPI00056C28BC|nr:DoxX family protein [Myxosarcina sp. GI1]
MTKEDRAIWLRRRDIVLAYVFLRIVFGVNFFNHGFTRIADISGFAQSMVDMFQNTFVPEVLVRVPGLLVPIVELIGGLLVTIGLFTQAALVTLFGLMIVLMYGVTLLQKWDTAGSQLIYCLVLFVLIAGNSFNSFSIDRLRRK